MQFVQPIPFDEAIDLIGDKSPIGAALSSSEWSDVPVALRQRAMFSANVENVRFLQRAQESLGDFLSANKITNPDGQSMLKTGGRAAFIDQMRQFAQAEGMGPLDPADKAGLKDITSEQRLGLVFDTQTRQAGDYGYWRQGQDADVLNEFPAQRFIRVIDVKEPRTSHLQYVNQVFLKNDPIWANVINEDFGVPWGPWAWGCGHDVEDVDREEAVSLGLLDENQRVEPDVKNFNENLQASTRGLDPDLIEKLQNTFGDQLTISDDGTMSWTDQSPQPAVPSPQPENLPAPDATPTAAPAQLQSPVSDALEIKVRGALRSAAKIALDAINQVHDDGDLPTIPLQTLRGASKNTLGALASIPLPDGSYSPEFIGIASHGSRPALTTVHEIGHFLDLGAIGPKGFFASAVGDPDMQLVLDAARGTKAIQGLMKFPPGYLLEPEEIWARAYSQYIAEKSGDATLLRDVANVRRADPLRQWDSADFQPVFAAIETLFRKLGWVTA